MKRMNLRNVLLVTLIFLLPAASAKSREEIALSTIADCVAFAGSLESYYEKYRKATGDTQYFDQEKNAGNLQSAWTQVLYRRAESEITHQKDIDAMNAHMAWIYKSSENLPDKTGLGNAVVIFENRISNCDSVLRKN